MSDKPPNAYSRCYACAEEQPDLIDHLGDPYVCGVIEDLRQQIAGLEAKAESLQDDANLGKLVRQMPEGFCLSHVSSKQVGGTWFCWRAGTGPEWPEWDKLVAALRKALGEERDE